MCVCAVLWTCLAHDGPGDALGFLRQAVVLAELLPHLLLLLPIWHHKGIGVQLSQESESRGKVLVFPHSDSTWLTRGDWHCIGLFAIRTTESHGEIYILIYLYTHWTDSLNCLNTSLTCLLFTIYKVRERKIISNTFFLFLFNDILFPEKKRILCCMSEIEHRTLIFACICSTHFQYRSISYSFRTRIQFTTSASR